MTASSDPAAVLSPLPRADGSATFSHGGFTITGSANGPIEAPRRDEDPYRAMVDVVVRPAAGVGGTSERHLESILRSSLEQLVLVQNFPRSLVQVVLQVQTSPQNEYSSAKLVQARLNLAIIPALLQTAVLACLSASIPLRATATATVVSVVRDAAGARALVTNPSARDVDRAASTHVFAFTSQQELLLAESEGDFTLSEWQKACAASRHVCARRATDSDMAVDDEDTTPDMPRFLRSTLEAKVASDLRWK